MFSAVSSQAINSIFSSSYDNYQIVVNLDSTSAASHTYWRLRNNTTDNSDTQYRHGGNLRNWAGTLDFVSGVETYGYFLAKRSTYQGFASTIYMYNPFKAIPTAWNFNSYYETGSNDANLTESGLHNVASSFNGINFLASAGNITGTISVYGFNK